MRTERVGSAAAAGLSAIVQVVSRTAGAGSGIGQGNTHAAETGLEDALHGGDAGGENARELFEHRVGGHGDANGDHFVDRHARCVKLLYFDRLDDGPRRGDEAETHEETDKYALAEGTVELAEEYGRGEREGNVGDDVDARTRVGSRLHDFDGHAVALGYAEIPSPGEGFAGDEQVEKDIEDAIGALQADDAEQKDAPGQRLLLDSQQREGNRHLETRHGKSPDANGDPSVPGCRHARLDGDHAGFCPLLQEQKGPVDDTETLWGISLNALFFL